MFSVAVRYLPPVDSTKECQELYDREEAAEVDVLTFADLGPSRFSLPSK